MSDPQDPDGGAPVRVRRDIWGLEEEQAWHPVTRAYARAVARLQTRAATDPTGWTYQAQVHGMPGFRQPDDFRGQCQHNSWFFLPWHRLYLYWFERIVRSCVEADPGSTTRRPGPGPCPTGTTRRAAPGRRCRGRSGSR